MVTRLTPDHRQTVILNAAVKVGLDEGLHRIRFDTVAEACEVPISQYGVKYHFPTRDTLWRAAITHENGTKLRDEAQRMGFA